MAQYDLILTQNVHVSGTEYAEKFVNIAKGDLLSADGSQVPTVLAGGTDGYSLIRDDAEITGLKWIEAPNVIADTHAENQVAVFTDCTQNLVGISLEILHHAGCLG